MNIQKVSNNPITLRTKKNTNKSIKCFYKTFIKTPNVKFEVCKESIAQGEMNYFIYLFIGKESFEISHLSSTLTQEKKSKLNSKKVEERRQKPEQKPEIKKLGKK